MKSHLRIFIPAFLVISTLFFPILSFGQAPNLRSLASFVIFTTTGALGNTGSSVITGNIGTNTGAITGFDNPGTLTGVKHNPGTVTAQCAEDLALAYDHLNNTEQTIYPSHAAVLGGGEVLTAGVYLIGGAGSINGILTLDAEDNPNAVFIFKVQGAFSPGPNSQISLIRGASAANIYWKVEGAIHIATLSDMKGTFIANNDAITIGVGSSLEGRALSTTGAINVNSVTMTIPSPGILPVTLIEFKASRINNVIDLLWTTAAEYSLDRYELERSGDGRNFQSIGSVAGTNSTIDKTYNWTDNSPLANMNFYRLKIIDIDYVFKYSEIVAISMIAKKGISVYPNPVTGQILQLQMYGQLKGDHILTLYNTQGVQVMSRRITASGNDAVRTFALDKHLQPGMYYLEISDPEKNKQLLKVLIN